LVPEGNFLEVRYEDLVASPAEVMRGVYDGLRLGGFDEARPRVEAFWREQAGYQTNRFPPLDPAVRAEIARRWGDVIERYGYAPPLQ
jgi:hypothetical protein